MDAHWGIARSSDVIEVLCDPSSKWSCGLPHIPLVARFADDVIDDVIVIAIHAVGDVLNIVGVSVGYDGSKRPKTTNGAAGATWKKACVPHSWSLVGESKDLMRGCSNGRPGMALPPPDWCDGRLSCVEVIVRATFGGPTQNLSEKNTATSMTRMVRVRWKDMVAVS